MKLLRYKLVFFIFLMAANFSFGQNKINFGYHTPEGKVKKTDYKIIESSKEESIDSINLSNNKLINKSLKSIDSLNHINLNKNDLLFNSDSNSSIHSSDTITIDVLLPFYVKENSVLNDKISSRNLDKNQIYNNSKLSISFLEGILFSVDSLSKSGLNFKINVYDTERDPTTVKEIIYNLNSSDIIFGPLYPEVFKIVKNYFRNDSNKVIVNPLSSRTNLLKNNRNVYFLHPNENVQKIFNLIDGRDVKIIKFKQNNDIYINQLIKKLNNDSINFQEYNFNNLKEINKRSCMPIMKENSIIICMEKDISFVDRLLSYCSTIDSDVLFVGSYKWKEFNDINIDNLMKLNVHIPVHNYFDRLSISNKKLLNDFENKFFHQMDQFSILSFHSILHFCSEKKQFKFKRFSENSGFINTNLKMCVFKEYELHPIN